MEDGITPAQFHEAERGIRSILARKFSANWIAANAEDVFGQVLVEYVEWRIDARARTVHA
jgi:hypothetical protein